MLLENLKKSTLVNTKNKLLSTSLLALMLSSNAMAGSHYDDYATVQLAKHVAQRVDISGKYYEVNLREALGCPTGELRDKLQGFLRHVEVAGNKLDITSDNFAETVDMIVTNEKYKQTQVCGDVPVVEEPDQKVVNFLNDKQRQELKQEPEVRNFEMPTEIRDSSSLFSKKTRKSLKL